MDEEKRKEYKEKAEAILFASGKRMRFDDIARLGRFRNIEMLQEVLEELKKEYDEKPGSLRIFNDNNIWKLSVSDQHLHTVKNIVSETELTKSVMETLAVIAFKYPMLQSDIVKIRSNKAYEHLKELDELGYISRQKHGRTNLIKLTDKFFEYFDLPQDKLKEQFRDFDGIAKAIETKEQEIRKIKEEKKEKEQKEKQESKLEVYDEKPKVEPYGGKLGKLEVVDEETEQKKEPEPANKIQAKYEQRQKQTKEIKGKQPEVIKQKEQQKPAESKADLLAKDIEEKSDKRAKEILGEEKEGDKKENEEEKKENDVSS